MEMKAWDIFSRNVPGFFYENLKGHVASLYNPNEGTGGGSAS